MSLDRVRKYLKEKDLSERLLVFDNSTATSQMAADEVGVQLGQICKTLAFKKKEGKGCILVMMSGDTRVKRNLFKRMFKVNPSMISPDEVKEYTGYEVGGVCAFDINNKDVDIYMDESLKRYNEIFPAGGSHNSMVKLTLEECFQLTGCKEWIDIGDIRTE